MATHIGCIGVSSAGLNKDPMERIIAMERSVHQMKDEQKSSDWPTVGLPEMLQRQGGGDGASRSDNTALRSPKLAYSASFKNPEVPSVFQMPLHYPRYSKADYETMPEWKVDRLLEEYGLPVSGSLHDKQQYAMRAFLWSY